jgi:nucleoid-associated protein EbfC
MEVKALQQMLTQFRQVQERLEKQIEEIRVEATAGGGMVAVQMNGQKQVMDLRIEPEVFLGRDQEMLQDLISAAVNEAVRRVDEELASRMKDLAGGMPNLMGNLKIPGLF